MRPAQPWEMCAAGTLEPRYAHHVVVARGADSWDIGLLNADDVDAAAALALARARRDRFQ